MRIVFHAVILFLVPALAHANLQFGVGSTMGTVCPVEQKPAKAATDNQDVLDNLDNQIEELQDELDEQRTAVERKQKAMEGAMKKMRRIFRPAAISAIEEHRSHRRSRSDYGSCPADSHGSYELIPRRSIASSEPAILPPTDANGNPLVIAPGGGGNPNPSPNPNPGGGHQPQSTRARLSFGLTINLDELFGGGKKPRGGSTGGESEGRPARAAADLIQPPSAFCADLNYWDAVALDDGKVRTDLCTKEGLPEVFKEQGPDYENDITACQDGLRAFYRATEDLNEIEEDLGPLERRLAALKKKRRNARADDTEAGICENCSPEERSSAKAGSADSLMASLGPAMVQLFVGLMNNPGGGQRRPPNVIVANNNGYPGSAPIILPPAQASLPGQNVPDYYPAQLPGYYNGGSGSQNYAAVDGGIGKGAFSCSDMNQQNGALDYPGWLIDIMNSNGKNGSGFGNNGSNNQFGPPGTVPPNPGLGGPPPIVAAQVGDYWGNMMQFQQGIGLGPDGATAVLPALGTEPPAILPALTPAQ